MAGLKHLFDIIALNIEHQMEIERAWGKIVEPRADELRAVRFNCHAQNLYFGVAENMLGGPPANGAKTGIRLIPKLAVGASAGPGAIPDHETPAGKIGFDEKWLRKQGLDPSKLSLIQVDGDSMSPTLNHGDDIMVDNRVAGAMRDGIHVIRFDDVLMVKRLASGPERRLSVLSNNPAYPGWPDVDGAAVTIIGRVVWAGRRL